MKKLLFVLFIFLMFPLSINSMQVELDRCIDGDTARFITANGSESTRFLAIDTPETVHPTKPEELFGKEASDFTCNKLMNAELIRLEFDDNSDMYDRYNRLLAWVFVDDELLQELIIKEGLGEVAYLFGDYKYTDVLMDAQDYAMANQLNIWGDYEEEEFEFDVLYLVSIYTIVLFINFIYFSNRPNNNATITNFLKKKKFKTLFIILYVLSIIFVLVDFGIFLDDMLKLKRKFKKVLN